MNWSSKFRFHIDSLQTNFSGKSTWYVGTGQKLSSINIKQVKWHACFWCKEKSKSPSGFALSTSRATLRFNQRIKSTTPTASTARTVTAPRTNTIKSSNISFSFSKMNKHYDYALSQIHFYRNIFDQDEEWIWEKKRI